MSPLETITSCDRRVEALSHTGLRLLAEELKHAQRLLQVEACSGAIDFSHPPNKLFDINFAVAIYVEKAPQLVDVLLFDSVCTEASQRLHATLDASPFLPADGAISILVDIVDEGQQGLHLGILRRHHPFNQLAPVRVRVLDCHVHDDAGDYVHKREEAEEHEKDKPPLVGSSYCPCGLGDYVPAHPAADRGKERIHAPLNAAEHGRDIETLLITET
mmetsp:Transcript_121860/g.344647  ORF Transcript_121860/g.344647 Transcript_121860/m.344647 type:complete len:217 (-) Transcript_121860:781-1431(-)